METFFGRYRNVSILVAVLFAQVLGLAVQVKRGTENESSRLIRIWAVNAVTPFEKGIVWCQTGVGNLWRNYLYLRGVRQENRDLKQEIERLRLERVRLQEDAEQARRLQALVGFKEQFIAKTLAAQVIGSSGSAQSRSVYLDKGSNDGIAPDMAVITAKGIVGKVLRAFGSSSQVLLIDDQTSGVGALLEHSRTQGVLRGTASGNLILDKVLSGEIVEPGEKVLTSGGDQIFPKGLPVGEVAEVSKGPESFLRIKVRPATNLGQLEEVLVIVQKQERMPVLTGTAPVRAADILAERLPSVPDKPAVTQSQGAAGGSQTTTAAPPKSTPVTKPEGTGAVAPNAGKPAVTLNRPAGAAPALVPATGQKPVSQPVKVSDPATKPEPKQTSEQPRPPAAKANSSGDQPQ